MHNNTSLSGARRILSFVLVALGISTLSLGSAAPVSEAQTQSRLFPETGKRVQGRFLDYWQRNGGLAQQGFPISDEIQEKSETDGKTYTVQYFERAIMEKHPENPAPNDVLLSLLGRSLYGRKYPTGAPGQTPNTGAGSQLFRETGKRLGGVFLSYWQKNGGLAQQGFPISDEFMEKSDLDGKTYRVQYFERAVMEQHPENPAPYNVLLSQLGTAKMKSRSSGAGLEPGTWRATGSIKIGMKCNEANCKKGSTGEMSHEVDLLIEVLPDGTARGEGRWRYARNVTMGCADCPDIQMSIKVDQTISITGKVVTGPNGQPQLVFSSRVEKINSSQCTNKMCKQTETNVSCDMYCAVGFECELKLNLLPGGNDIQKQANFDSCFTDEDTIPTWLSFLGTKGCPITKEIKPFTLTKIK